MTNELTTESTPLKMSKQTNEDNSEIVLSVANLFITKINTKLLQNLAMMPEKTELKELC